MPDRRKPSPAIRQARRSVRFQRLGIAKGVAGAVTSISMVLPALAVLQGRKRPGRPRLSMILMRGVARSLGIRIVSHGRPPPGKGVLYVANHLSWADIPVLGARLRANFVAKSEVAGWGVVGWMATVAGTVYVDRGRRLRSGEQRDAIAERLAAGDNIILFPEGTNGDGTHVLPFKSSLFAVTDPLPDLIIQPVTIAYTRVNGMPVTRERLPELAWVGDTELMPHAMALMSLGRIVAEIIFHAPVRAGDFGNRKALAGHCETVIADGYRRLMRG